MALPREGPNTILSKDANGNPIQIPSTLDANSRDANGNLILIGTDGKAIPTLNGGFGILSRQVMRVRIPANVKTAMREDNQQVVELYVSTPNGISNKLQIPLTPASKAAASPPPPPVFAVATTPGFTFVDTTLAIPVSGYMVGTGTTATLTVSAKNPFPTGTQIRIEPNLLPTPPAAIDLQVVFQMNGVLLPVTLTNVPLDSNNNYVLSGTLLDNFAGQVYNLLSLNNLPFPATQATALVARPAQIQAVAQQGMIPTTFTATNSLSVTFDVSLIPPPKPAPAAALRLLLQPCRPLPQQPRVARPPPFSQGPAQPLRSQAATVPAGRCRPIAPWTGWRGRHRLILPSRTNFHCSRPWKRSRSRRNSLNRPGLLRADPACHRDYRCRRDCRCHRDC